MCLEEQLLSKFGPLLTLKQLAEVLHRSPQGLTFTLSRDSDFAQQINSTKLRLGRRVYFRSNLLAAVLEGQTSDLTN